MTGWFVLAGETLESLLDRASKGEDPALLMVELYANSDRESQR